MKVFAQNRTAAFDKRAVIKCAVAVALLVAASKVSFAIGPVPLTMQTFAVAVVGAWLGTRQGVAAVIAYLALGFAGLPVFIVAFGALWLSASIGVEKAVLVGFVPFVIGALLKAILGTAVLYAKELSSRQ